MSTAQKALFIGGTGRISSHSVTGSIAKGFETYVLNRGQTGIRPVAEAAHFLMGDARNAEMQKKMNLKIKYRESFRPFAPSVLTEKANEYFEMHVDGLTPQLGK